MRIYEGMFVLNDSRCNDNWEAVTSEVNAILEKSGAEIFTAEKWDERRLAYSIRGRTRGVYYLVRFTAAPDALKEFERASIHLAEAERCGFTVNADFKQKVLRALGKDWKRPDPRK